MLVLDGATSSVAVKKSVEKVLQGENAGKVADRDHADWCRELFAPSVTAGLIRAADFAGYRSGPASVNGNIEPFSTFLGALVRDNLEGKPGPKVPER